MVFTIRTIIEVIGHPEPHVNEVASKVLENLKKEPGITVLKEGLSKAELVKSDIFASHLEIELKLVDMNRLLSFCYEYLPSSVEIIDAKKIVIPTREVTIALGEMLRKLHGYNLMLHNLNEKNKELSQAFEKKEKKI